MLTRSNLQAVVPQVLQRLREITDLPNHGTVAGQAVASIFFEELGLDIRGPVNDVDVFVSVSGKTTGSSALSTFSTEEDKYNHIKFISSSKNLSIVATSTDEALNTTQITYPGATTDQIHSQTISQLLVEGFDINEVAVGINLASHSMVCSSEFLKFLEHREMKVVSWLTPAHTLVRLARKMYSGQLHNVHCNYAQQREQLEQVLFLMSHSSFSGRLNCPIQFGERYKKYVEQLHSYLPSITVDPLRNDLFVFDTSSTPQREQVRDKLLPLVDNMGSGVNAFLFYYNFDRLFATILANEPYGTSISDILELGKDHSVSDGQLISRANQMMGGQPLVHPINLEENECAVLFLGYDDRDNPQKVAQIVSVYNSLCDFEKRIFSVEPNLNRLLEFATSPLDWAYEQLMQKEGLAFVQWTNSLKTDRDAQLFIQLMKRVGENDLLREHLSLDFLDARMGASQYTFAMFDHLSAHNKNLAFNSIVENIYQGQDKILTLDADNLKHMMDWMDYNSLPVEHILKTLPSQHVVGFLMSSYRGTSSPSDIQLANLASALKLVRDDTLMADNGFILCNLLFKEYLPVLQNRVAHIDSSVWTTKWIERVGANLSNNIFDEAKGKKALFETLMLYREIGHTSFTSARRKI